MAEEVKAPSGDEKKKGSRATLQEGILAFVQRADSVKAIQSFADSTSTAIVGMHKGSIRQAVRYLGAKSSPTFLIVDIADKTDITRDMMELADVCDPGVSVVVLGNVQDIGLYRELKGLGVKDYFIHPLTPESLYDAFDERSSSRMNKSVAFIGASGGCGATTLATTCSWMLAEESKYYTALVDFDILHGSVAHLLNRQISESVSAALEHPERVDRLFMDRSMDAVSDRLSVLSGVVSPQKMANLTLRGYSEVMNRIAARFRYAVMDIPRWNHLALRAAIASSQSIVVIFTPDIISLRNAVEIMHHIVKTYKSRARTIVVMNQGGRYRTGEMSAEQFKGITGHSVDHIIRFDNSALDSINKGGYFSNRASPIYAASRRLTMTIGGRSSQAPAGLTSVFSRILGGASEKVRA